MKREKDLWYKIIDTSNLCEALHNAAKGKKHYHDVKAAMFDPLKTVYLLHELLESGKFTNSSYHVFQRRCSNKIRNISKLPFYPDRIVHHAVVRVLEPIFMRMFIDQTYSTIPKRGVHQGVKDIQRALLGAERTKYCLKIDITKYYPSINHDILLSQLSRRIKDRRTLALLEVIIRSAPGIPIGNLISQWFGNIYTAQFDRWVKEHLKCRYFFRYCDDMVFLAPNKQVLHNYLHQIRHYLDQKLHLKIKDNYQIFPVSKRGIDFLGYRFFHGYTLVRKSIVKSMKRKTDKPKSMASYYGWLIHADTYRLRQKYFKDKSYAA